MLDLSIFCRTCMCQIAGNTEVNLKSYNVSEYIGLAEKLERCLAIKVQPSDAYPPRVCEICFVKVCDFYEFQQMCQHSLYKFVEMLREHSALGLYVVKSLDDDSVDHTENGNYIHDIRSWPGIEYVVENETENDPQLDINNSSERVEIEIERFDVTNVAAECLKEADRPEPGNTLKAENTPRAVVQEEVTCEPTESIPCQENLYVFSEEEELLLENSEFSHGLKNTKSVMKKRFQCELCPKRFLLQHCLDGHMRSHLGLLDHPCPREHCERSYRRLCDLRQHLRDHDGLPREYRCAKGGCDSMFSRFGDLLKHRIEKHGAPKFYKCDFKMCGQEFKSKTYLKRHKEKRHSDGPQKPPESHMCDTCGAVLRSAATLRVHTMIHIERSKWPFVCDVEGCSKRFRVQQDLTIHKYRHAGIKNYSCPHCDKRFVTSTNLKNHINTHTWERTWNCKLCPKICNTPDALRKHTENKHGIIKRYPCSICQRHFNTANAKMYHEMSHVGDEEIYEQPNQFPCGYCNRTFDSQSRKKYHEMIHTGEKPHVCEECGKGFRTTTLLKTHKRSHMQELPRDYVCSVCDRAFFSAQSMKHHEMKHTKEKPYKCDECGFSFRWPNNLTRHRKLHLKDKTSNANTKDEINADNYDNLLDIK